MFRDTTLQQLKKMGGGPGLLSEFMVQWRNYLILSKWISKTFNYLDRYYLKFSNMDSTVLTAIKLFKKNIFETLKTEMVESVLTEIRKWRETEDVNWEVLHMVIECFITIGITKNAKIEKGTAGEGSLKWGGEQNLNDYDSLFEKNFIKNTQEYYKSQAEIWGMNMSAPEYVRKALSRFEEEEKKAEEHMQPKTKGQLISTMCRELVEIKAEEIVQKETGCKSMLKNEKLDELKEMYDLYSKVDTTLKYILNEMGPYIEERGKAIIDDVELKKDPVKLTKQLLALKAEMDRMVNYCFNNDPKFNQTRDKSFSAFMNLWSETPYAMAAYCDQMFKTGIRGMSQDQIEEELNAIIRLFCCLNNRDVFIRAYSKFQASRLLDKTSLNTEMEESMISKLKVECGFNTVSKLSRMFTDMETSKQVMAEFKQTAGGAEASDCKINSDILSTGIWPEQTTHPVKLPPQLMDCANKFELFYKNKYSGRHLSWLHGSCTVVLEPLYTKEKYGFTVSVYQAAILLLFQQKGTADQFTCKQIADATNLPMKELEIQMKYLCNPKMKCLKKGNAKTPKITEAETIQINEAFKNPSLKVNFVPKKTHKKKTVDEKGAIETQVEQEIKMERQFVLEAIIVRIMKARKTERHEALIAEVIRQVSLFSPQPVMIKEAIERLIEKEYLKRDDDDRKLYIYIP